ncbi:MAG TPA: dihydroxy-acid dehydratase, partial [Thermoanaerobacterales bacterium]|nr:dihydroxy-acid dehydratase [Thermoanaerobacterales bacterium]
ENAIMVMMAVGGSSNVVIHSSAIAHELGIDSDLIMSAFDKYSEMIPLLAKINPSTHKYDAVDMYYAGGVPEVMKKIRKFLHDDQITVTGKTMGENLDNFKNPYPANDDLIRSLDNPHSTLGGLAIMRGNLAPNTGVSKPAAIHPDVRLFTGKAICFASENECVAAIENKEIKPGHVVVIRYEGPKGGPGMKELYKPMKLLYGQGLSKTTALITDGRFSGTNNGCFVGHISPEAAAGGPLAVVEDGDSITIDVNNKAITLNISDEELKERMIKWVYKPKEINGYLKRYSAMVTSADKGGVLEV